MNSIESIPQVWDDERDGQFFRITQSLFDPSYCYGAGVLLASYDTDDELFATTQTTTYDAQPADDAAITSTTSTSAR
jgi:hypothetical protein